MTPLFCVAVALAALSPFNTAQATVLDAVWVTYYPYLAPSDCEAPTEEPNTEPPPHASTTEVPASTTEFAASTTEVHASPTRVGLNGYRRYYANDSFFGNPIPCSYDEKVCFKYNRMFNPTKKRCTNVGGNIYFCELRPDRKEFQNGFGRLTGECKKYRDPCPGYRMEYDQRCYRKKTVRDVICGGSNLTRHFLGGVECLSKEKKPISVQQPPEEGQCRIPDLRFPVDQSAFFHSPLVHLQGFYSDWLNAHYANKSVSLQCTTEQAACFKNRSLGVAGHAGCFPLLRRGPCPEDHVVALDAEAASGGRAEATCVHVRGGCAPGHKRMAFDGQCHEDRAIAISAPGKIIWNQFGQRIVISFEYRVALAPAVDKQGRCVLVVTLHAEGGGVTGEIPFPPCGANNKGMCSLFEVEEDPPLPEED